MVAYSFKARFAAPIIAGTKRQTIRADRKRHARPGEALQLYTGMRTKQCRLIGRATCEAIAPITIDTNCQLLECAGVTLNDRRDLDRFARADGFEDWRAMRAFWQANHSDAPVFTGVLIKWADFCGAEA